MVMHVAMCCIVAIYYCCMYDIASIILQCRRMAISMPSIGVKIIKSLINQLVMNWQV